MIGVLLSGGGILELAEKAQVLIDVAMAYLQRGNCIQYDQRCMDRSLFLTPRRIKRIPPEAATVQNTVYLDCSSFVGAVYLEAFGYELPADLTWHMVDLVKPAVYYHEFTHTETALEKQAIEHAIRQVLLPGDVITYDRGVGSGHTMLYMGDEGFIHCTPNGRPDSYDYVNCKSREYEDGGLFIVPLEELFTRRLFQPNVRRVAVARPLMQVDTPTERTKKRLDAAKGLQCGVTVSHPGFRHVVVGEKLEYRVQIKDTVDIPHKVQVTFRAPAGTISTEAESILQLDPGAQQEAVFTVEVTQDCAPVLTDAAVSVCGMDIFVPQVLVGRSAPLQGVVQALTGTSPDEKAISDAYAACGISTDDQAQKAIWRLFYLHDSPKGDVLSRRAQDPYTDGAVYGLFGGTGVITPERISHPFIRANQITRRDFLPGDIIVVSPDALGKDAYMLFYTGSALLGTREIPDPETFFDSLLGQFCFVVLRPYL